MKENEKNMEEEEKKKDCKQEETIENNLKNTPEIVKENNESESKNTTNSIVKKEENKKTEEENKSNEELKKNEVKEKINVEDKIIINEEKQENTKTKNTKMIVPVIVLTVFICLLLLFSVIFALININNDKILSGVSIMGIDVSNLNPKEAKNKIEEITNKNLSEEITLKYEEYETTINGNQFNAKMDIEKAINDAYNIGKTGNIIINNYNILSTYLFKKNIEVPIFYNEDTLNKILQDTSLKLPGAVKQSSYYVEDEKLIIVKGTKGIKIKENDVKEEIIKQIQQIDNRNTIITIMVEEVQPDDIDLEKIRQEIYKEPKNAYVSKNPTTVHPHVNGVDFKISIEDAQKLLQEDKKEYTIPLKITIPSKTIKDLGEEAFPDLISTYTTRYDPSNYNRSNNLTIAASKINGTILMPGEIFSYNKVVGERTIAAGYKAAGAYAGGRIVQDVGGGICQISSTIYNTALLANLEIVDRSNHQFQTSYVPVSRDATVSWGYLDFKFKNNRTYPIKIVASAKNGVSKVSFYGIKEKTEYEVVLQSKVLSYIPYSVKYIEDSTLEEGKEIVEQSGYNGCKSEAYRILKFNGKIISKTLLSRDTYDPMQRIVRRGTKKAKTPTNN